MHPYQQVTKTENLHRMKRNETIQLVEDYGQDGVCMEWGSGVGMTRVEKLKKLLLKISERGDIHEFFGLRGGGARSRQPLA